MTLTVQFYELDKTDPVGSLTYDSETGVVTPSEENHLFDNILEDPILVLEGGEQREVYVTDDVETFMRNLYKHYKSIGLRASEAEEL